MKIIKVNNSDEGGKIGCQIFADEKNNGGTVFGLATGSTPISIYEQLVNSSLDFSNCTSINLDEYVGLDVNHPQSYHYFMQEHLFNKKSFKKSYVPDGMNPDADEVSRQYEKIINDHPIDLQILGLGRNGHIGFNEPKTAFDSVTHKVTLTQSTIDANARFFDNEDDVPRYAYSMGIGTILKAKKILVVAYGAEKAQAVKAMVEGDITVDCPASALQTHNDVTVIVDAAAGSEL